MNPSYSYNHPNVQSSMNQPEHEGRKSFVDNKPMIQGLVRSVLKVEKNGEAHLINTGLTDVEGAKQIAHNLFSFYDKDRSGNIDPVKVCLFVFRLCLFWQIPIVYSTQITTLRNRM